MDAVARVEARGSLSGWENVRGSEQLRRHSYTFCVCIIYTRAFFGKETKLSFILQLGSLVFIHADSFEV